MELLTGAHIVMCNKQSIRSIDTWSTSVRHAVAQKWALTPFLRAVAKTTELEGLSLQAWPPLGQNSPQFVPTGHRPALLGNQQSLGAHNTSHNSVYSNREWK